MARSDEAILTGSALAAAGAVARREVGSRELTGATLARIAALNPALNGVVQLRESAALSEADAADAAVAAGDPLGPLHGVPVTIKEAFHVAEMRCTWGNPDWRDAISDEDATVVARMRQAGAIVIGTTNVAAMLGDFGQTANELYGRTRNPWDRSRSAGGSSGGAAAAVAAGMSFVDYGSDLVGSIRIPAAFCGIYGLRPTSGLVPVTGFAPPGQSAAASALTDVSTVGPFARSAADLRAVLGATAGADGFDGTALTVPGRPSRHRRLADFRIGLVLDDPRAPVTAEVGGVLSDVADAVATAGATIVPGWPEGVDPGASAEAFGFAVGLFFAAAQPGGEEFAPLSAVIAHEWERSRLRAAWSRYFADVDVLLCPANFTTAFPHDQRPFDQRSVPTENGPRPYTEQPFWTAHAAVAGLPALTAPAGSANGLPVGLQILGPRFEDDTVLTFAELLADLVGGFRPPKMTG